MAPIGILLALALAQQTQAGGAVTVTNKGISLIPALTLGKPAAIFDVAITNGAFGFEPQFRFGLDGKPWSFIFWGRYRPLRTGRLRLTIGAHPSFTFRTVNDAIVTRRYLAGDVFPSYFLTTHLSVGPYYFYAHGLDPAAFQHTHFAGARAYLTNVAVPGQFVLHFAPQLYYLWMDREDGVYVTSVLTLGHRKLPFAVSTLVNSPIRSSIAGGQEFLWNLSLTYAMR
ncbi:MAG TPA: hypothetical protein VFO67_19585 [Gemmatimonadales bacterium]|nr:hypothetical protein [Gemmatimonadales bacterium]